MPVVKRAAIVLLMCAALLTARPADAGFKSAMKATGKGLKKAAKTVGHVAENAVYVAAAVGAVFIICKSGACN